MDNLEEKLDQEEAEKILCSIYSPLQFQKLLTQLGFIDKDAKDLTKFYKEYIYIPVCEAYINFLKIK